jgi:hypothetical protein
MYLDNTYAPKDYRRWLAERVRPILRDHGLALGDVDPATGSMGFTADAPPRSSDESPLKRADPGYAHRGEYRPTGRATPGGGNGRPSLGAVRSSALAGVPANDRARPVGGPEPRLF